LLIRICFSWFDTRYYLETPPDDERLPKWQLKDPGFRPAFDRVGNLGPVLETIPPFTYGKCRADRLIAWPDQASDSPKVSGTPEITIMVDNQGHGRLVIELRILPNADQQRLSDIVDALLKQQITVRNPSLLGETTNLFEAADALADCFGRESARTARTPTAFKLDWIKAARPFLVLTAESDDRWAHDGLSFSVPKPGQPFDGSLDFLPWRIEDELPPAWLFRSHRGGQAFKPSREAIEDLTAHFQEYLTCLRLTRNGDLSPAPRSDQAVRLRRYIEKRRGLFSRPLIAGLDRSCIMRLLVDYEQAAFAVGETAAAEIEALVKADSSTPGYGFGPVPSNVTINIRNYDMSMNVSGTGNIVNLGTMIAESISTTNNIVDQAAAGDDLKSKLKELNLAIAETAKHLPADEAKILLEDAEDFTRKALRPKPEAAVVTAQATSITERISKLAAVATPVVSLVAAVVKLLGFTLP
jgi:hypothetical protein